VPYGNYENARAQLGIDHRLTKFNDPAGQWPSRTDEPNDRRRYGAAVLRVRVQVRVVGSRFGVRNPNPEPRTGNREPNLNTNREPRTRKR